MSDNKITIMTQGNKLTKLERAFLSSTLDKDDIELSITCDEDGNIYIEGEMSDEVKG
jgi:hypothetical protein